MSYDPEEAEELAEAVKNFVFEDTASFMLNIDSEPVFLKSDNTDFNASRLEIIEL